MHDTHCLDGGVVALSQCVLRLVVRVLTKFRLNRPSADVEFECFSFRTAHSPRLLLQNVGDLAEVAQRHLVSRDPVRKRRCNDRSCISIRTILTSSASHHQRVSPSYAPPITIISDAASPLISIPTISIGPIHVGCLPAAVQTLSCKIHPDPCRGYSHASNSVGRTDQIVHDILHTHESLFKTCILRLSRRICNPHRQIEMEHS